MSYKVEFDELDAFSNRLQANVKLWLQMLQTVGESAESLSKSGNMGGAGAENIRAYVTNVHLSLVSALMQLLSMHEYNAINYQNDYESKIDSDLHAVIHASELKNIRLRTETERRRSLQIDEAVNYTLNGIRDVFSLACPNVFNVDQAHQTVIRRIDTLDQDILDLERRHSGDDFTETGDLIRTMQAFVSEMLGQGRSYKEGFTPEQLASSESFRAMYYSVLAVSKRLDEKADEIEAAIENQNERLELLQEEYEERQRKAAITKWVVTGVCVVGSVVAIAATGGAATPLVVGAISAASGAVIAGTNNVMDSYVEHGDFRHIDWKDFGKDVAVAGAVGFATGYLGASVGQAVTGWASTTHTGAALLNSSNAAVRFGSGAVIGSSSQVVSGVVSRGTGSVVEQYLTEGQVDLEKVGSAAFDPKNIVIDAATGGASGGIGALKKPMGKEVSLEDLKDSDLMDTKPDHSPTPKRWIEEEGGKIYVDGNGTWTYEYSDGTHVCYTDGYPDFDRAGLVEESVDIGGFSDNRQTDFRNAEAISPKPPNTTWHHHQDQHTLQAVNTKYHDIFRHTGGFSLSKGG